MGVSDGEVLEKGSRKNARELKIELQRLAMEIIADRDDDDDDGQERENANENEKGLILDTINKAIQTLSSLKELKLKKKQQKKKRSLSSQLDAIDVPDEFRCPISRELMRDPVVLATGQVWIQSQILLFPWVFVVIIWFVIVGFF